MLKNKRLATNWHSYSRKLSFQTLGYQLTPDTPPGSYKQLCELPLARKVQRELPRLHAGPAAVEGREKIAELISLEILFLLRAALPGFLYAVRLARELLEASVRDGRELRHAFPEGKDRVHFSLRMTQETLIHASASLRLSQ